MTWLAENWFWLVVAAAFIGLHLFGHGGHGGHGGRGGGCGHGGHGSPDKGKSEDADQASQKPAGHQH